MFNCRTCLAELTDNYVTLKEDSESTQIRKELSECVPEMSIDIVEDPVMCQQCVTTLHVSHEFRMKCLETEKEINRYLKLAETTEKLTSGTLDISSSYSSPSNLIEDLNDMLDDILEPSDTSKSVEQCEDAEEDIIVINEQCEDAEEDIIAINNICKSIFKSREYVYPPEANTQNSLKALEERIIGNINKEYENLPISSEQVEDNKEAKETDELHTCKQCGFRASSRHNLRVHQKEVEHAFVCSVCAAYFTTESSFKHHFENNKCQTMEQMKSICQLNPCSEEPFVCKICKNAFKTLSLLKNHAKCHNIKIKKRNYSCPHCPYKTVNKRRVLGHTKAVCFFCGQKSLCNSTLQAHILDIHLQTESAIQEMFLQVCPICKLTVGGGQTQLFRHMKTHKDGSSFICNFCSYKSTSWHEFEIHMQQHTRDMKPNQSLEEIKKKVRFRCNQCMFETRSLSSLNRHKRIHTPNKLSCPYCPFQTRTKVMLQNHKKIMHHPQIFSCSNCKFQSESETDYKIHTNFHCKENVIDGGSVF